MATITLGGSDYPSFTSRADATVFLAGDIVRATPWALLNDDAQDRALISATRMLLGLPWCGDTPDPADDAGTPELVKDVTAMLASDLASKPKLFLDATGDSAVKSVKAGSAQVEFFHPITGGPPLPKALWMLLLNAGLVCLHSSGSAVNDGAFVSGIMGSGCRPLGGRPAWDWPVACSDYD